MTSTPCAPLVSLIYVSSAVELFSTADLTALLEVSRRNNTRAGITGMLLYKDGNFLQVIEGEKDQIHRLHQKIAGDPRHGGLITLLQKKIAQRQFGDWSMGFKNLSDPTLRAKAGFSDFLNLPLTDTAFTAKPSQAEKLLLAFKQKM